MNENLDEHIFELGFPQWRDVADRRSFEREFGALWKVRLVTSKIAVTEHYYKPGGGDQFQLEVGANRALTVLRDPIAVEAMSTLNLRLMRKGPNYWSTSHCIDLVTAAYESIDGPA